MKQSLLYLFLAGSLLLASCTKNFNSVYSDPEALKNTAAGLFLNDILYDGVNAGLYEALNVNNELTQTTVNQTETVEIHRYIFKTSVFDYSWNTYYPILNNVKDMRAAAKRDKQPNEEAVSLVLWAWLYENLLDTYGDLPYDQALQGYPNFQLQNQFNRQDYVYQDLVNKLDTANNLFNTAVTLESGSDYLYTATDTTGGYKTIKWKKLANTLRLRLLMRVASKSSDARAQINIILSNPTKYPLMASNAETATLRYSGVAPFVNPYATARTIDWNGSRSMTQFFINNLKSWNDPRMPIWCTTTSGQYVGLPSGFARSETDSIAAIPASTLTTGLASSSLMGQIMQYAELQFIIAEAIQKGYTQGNAQTYYEAGVKAAIEYWGATMPSDFLTRPGVKYDGTLQQLMLQKYYGLFFNDMQQWAEIRRTGFPVLPRGDATVGKTYPTRLQYPLLLQTANAANYKQAVINMGGDSTTTKLWWEQ